jgi:hypothetical protein
LEFNSVKTSPQSPSSSLLYGLSSFDYCRRILYDADSNAQELWMVGQSGSVVELIGDFHYHESHRKLNSKLRLRSLRFRLKCC